VEVEDAESLASVRTQLQQLELQQAWREWEREQQQYEGMGLRIVGEQVAEAALRYSQCSRVLLQ